ncbi:MAG TPA: hypothetical protein VNT81_20310 [Vicinamibacterales bacterium]|nr:hypothetical protein [Vicinamibacterales bacterium]
MIPTRARRFVIRIAALTAFLALFQGSASAQLPTTFTVLREVEFAPATVQQQKTLSAMPYLRDLVAEPFLIAREDLNDDGSREIILMATTSAFCGSGGCRVVVLEGRAGQTVVILDQNFMAVPGITNEKIGEYRLLAMVDKGVVLTGDKQGTPLFGKPMVFPVKVTQRAGGAPAPRPAPPAAGPAPAPVPVAPPGAPAPAPVPPSASAPASSGTNPDVIGIKIGVSTVEEVRAILNAPNLNLLVEERMLELVGQSTAGRGASTTVDIPNSVHVGYLSGTSKTYKPSGYDAPCSQVTVNCQHLGATFSGPPGKGRVLALTRTIHFAERPLTDVVIKGLVSKYGQPGFQDSYGDKGVQLTLRWAWAPNGSPIILNDRHACASQLAATMTTNGSIDRSEAALRAGCAVMLFVIINQQNSATEFQTVHLIDHNAIVTSTLQTRRLVADGVARYEDCERRRAANTQVPSEFGDAPAAVKPNPATTGSVSPCEPRKHH